MKTYALGGKTFLLLLVFVFTFLLPLLPLPAEAAIIPCGTTASPEPCTLCHLIVGISNVIDWMRNVMAAIAIAVIVAMGILYIVSTGNEGLMKTAKSGIMAALIGFALILSAWLIVNVIFNLPIFKVGGLVEKNWSTRTCDLASSAMTGKDIAQKSITSKTAVNPPGPNPPGPLPGPPGPSGVTLTIAIPQSGFLYPGNTATLTLTGSNLFNAGTISFQTDDSGVSVPNTSTPTQTLTISSAMRPPIAGTIVTVKAYQGGTFLAQVTFTVSAVPNSPGGGDTGGGTPYNPGGGQPQPPTPGPAQDFCGQYPNVVRMNLTYGGYIDSHLLGGFPADAVLVGRLQIPANATGTTFSGVISVVEFIDPQAARTMTVSPSSCDFRGFQAGVFPPINPTGTNNPMAWSFGINPNTLYSLSTMPGSGVKLVPGQTYYVNLRNVDFNGVASCQGATCNVRITVNRPQ